MPVLPRVNDYDSLYRQFRWAVPARYNIGVDVCDRWAENEPDRLAILHARPEDVEQSLAQLVARRPDSWRRRTFQASTFELSRDDAHDWVSIVRDKLGALSRPNGQISALALLVRRGLRRLKHITLP